MKKLSYTLSSLMLSLTILNTPITYASSAIQGDSTTLNSGVTTSGTLAFKGDIKYYSISPIKDGQIYLSLENVSAELGVQIVDGNGSQVSYLDTFYDSNKSLNVKVQKGTYFIKVFSQNWNSSTNSATFNIKTIYPSDQTSSTPTETLNQTIGNATLVSSGQKIEGDLASNVDVNYYKFISEGDGALHIRIENLTAPVSVILSDQNGNKVVQANSVSTQNFAINQSIPKGIYYLKVTPLSWDPTTLHGTYNITPTFLTQKIVRDSKSEPNDTIDNAYRLHSDEQYNVVLSSNVDVNYYKVQLKGTGALHLNFDQISNPIIAQIFDSNGNSIGYMDSNNTQTLNSALEQGTIYIKVSPAQWDDRTTGTFTIKASFPEDNDYKIKVNGVNLATDQPPAMVNGRTLVPFRTILEALGATVNWDSSNSTITATKGATTISMPINSPEAKINGNAVQLDVPATIMNNRTMVPVRFVSEGLNEQVDWDSENWTVNITDKSNPTTSTESATQTLPSLTQNGITVSVNKFSIVNSNPIFDVSVSNNSENYAQVSGLGIEQGEGNSIQTSTIQPDGPWVKKMNPNSTFTGKVSFPVNVDTLVPTIKLNVKVQTDASSTPILFQLDTPIPR